MANNTSMVKRVDELNPLITFVSVHSVIDLFFQLGNLRIARFVEFDFDSLFG